jgi:hypothetical protein
MAKTLLDITQDNIRTYGTESNKFADFPIGTRVKIIVPYEDFVFFYGERGRVVENSGKHLGIVVELDEPRHYKDGTIEIIEMRSIFNPTSLFILDKETEKIEDKKEDQEQRSKRFGIIDL